MQIPNRTLLINSIEKNITDKGEDNPYLKSISERAEAIQDNFDDRQITSREALKKIEQLINEIVEARRQQEKTGFDINTFTIYWSLKQENIKSPENIAPVVNGVFLRFPNYKHNVAELRQLKAELYKIVLPIVGKERMAQIVEKLLKLKRKQI